MDILFICVSIISGFCTLKRPVATWHCGNIDNPAGNGRNMARCTSMGMCISRHSPGKDGHFDSEYFVGRPARDCIA